jgi:hypothetical protein
LIPFATLPACAQKCGLLYDANGACVPPGAPTNDVSVYDSCFCNDARLAPFKTGTVGVCPDAAGCAPDALGSIRNWFTSFCAANGVAQTATTTALRSGGTGGPTSVGGGGNAPSGDW